MRARYLPIFALKAVTSTGLGLTLVAAALPATASVPAFGVGTATGPAAAVQKTENQGAVYMRAKSATVLRNFEDENGSPLATLPAGTLVRAFRTSQGRPAFREVEVAGGFPVWVYGEYLQPTDTTGVWLVTGTRVNMRPLPETSPASMALRSKLNAGQRVQMIERAGKSAAFGEDWIRVTAPVQAKAWVMASSLEVCDKRLGAAEWQERNVPLPSSRPVNRSSVLPAGPGATSPSARPEPVSRGSISAVSTQILSQLVEADKAFEAAEALRSPTTEAWRDVANAYRDIVELAPATSATYQKSMRRLRESKMRMEYTALREDLNAASTRNDDEIRRIDEFLDERQRRKTARWGRFEERGWLESRKFGTERRWYLTFGGETVAEVRCMSQRYDLDVFERFEIGVIGREMVPVVRGTPSSLPEARVVDVQRIEVLSGTARRR